MKVALKIQRFNPETDKRPHWQEFEAEVEPTDRLLDALNYVKWYVDGTLAFRRSCAHGICGSDAMTVNGVNRLACKVLIRDLKQPVVIQPLVGMPILKDLIVDMEPFFAAYRRVRPYLITSDQPPATERLQAPEERERYDETTRCILCAACTSSCPAYWANNEYVGPAAIVQAHRFIFDSRDRGAGERLRILSERTGVFRCRTTFNCTEACPRGIQVTKAIQEVKRAILFERF